MTIEPAPIRVLIVDDHPVVRFGLAAIINLQGDMAVVGEAGIGEEACALCEERPVDVVLMDLRLPGRAASTPFGRSAPFVPTIRFIVLTTYAGDEDIHRALDAGAHAYLLKGMSHAEVTAACARCTRAAGSSLSRSRRPWPSGGPTRS